MSNPEASHDAGHGDHPPFLQHHFDTPLQQFDAGKLGMWLFLATEVLLFGGLFCAYAVYRGNHPEIFMWAHTFLDTNLGAINTVILLCSSLTMAWGVRAAQLGQMQLMRILLVLTLLGGFGFMGIKYVEYKSKWEHGLLWARSYDPHFEEHHADEEHHGEEAGDHGAAGAAGGAGDHGTSGAEDTAHTDTAAASEANAADGAPGATPAGFKIERSQVGPAAQGPGGLAVATTEAADHGGKYKSSADAPANVQVFFSVYFLMTGLHGLHVVIGMILIFWIFLKSFGGVFGPAYFTPVDLVGLYWHLVDLIWIFLFPLLYLIH